MALILEIESAVLRMFFSVTVWAELRYPTATAANERLEGVNVTGSVPVPLRADD